MDSGLYAACAAMMARTDALDTIANNLANSSTSGFRGRQTTFSSVLAGHGQQFNSQLNEGINSFGLMGGSHLDMRSGSLERTGNSLDVGIDGPGFLQVQTASGKAYTRSGNLKLSPKGELTTQTGDAVLDSKGGTITLPRGAQITISEDGTLSADGAVAGKLRVVEFAATSDPQSLGGANYTVPDKDVSDAKASVVRQGMVESSNVNPISSVVELINAQRATEGMRHALSMIDTEIDKTAAQDIPRVSA